MPDEPEAISGEPARALMYRIGIAAVFGLVVPVVLIVLFHAKGGATIQINKKPLDISTPLGWVLNPIDVLIVITSWCTTLVAETLFELVVMGRRHDDWHREHKKELERRWVPSNDFDCCLIELRNHYEVISAKARANPDLFTKYYYDRLQAMGRQMAVSAGNSQLSVNQVHFETTDILMECLQGKHHDQDDDFWAVHYLNEESKEFFLKVPHARNYARVVAQKVAAGQIKTVRRLFVVDDTTPGAEAAELADEFARRYIAFHKANAPTYQYCIVGQSEYESGYIADNHEEQLARDFGIYGALYVYETGIADPQAIEGIFTSNEARIKQYRALFDRCWENEGKTYEEYSDDPLPTDVHSPNDIWLPFWVEERPGRHGPAPH